MKKIHLILPLLFFTSLHAGCVLRDVVNMSQDCQVIVHNLAAEPKKPGAQAPHVTRMNQTVGAYLNFTVVKRTLWSLECKEYRINVDATNQRGDIRLQRRDACGPGQDTSFDTILTFENVQLDHCLVDLQVRDMSDISMEVQSILPETKQETKVDSSVHAKKRTSVGVV